MALVVLILLLALTACPVIAGRALRRSFDAAGWLRTGVGRWALAATTAYAWARTVRAVVTRPGLAARLALATRWDAPWNAGLHQSAERGGGLTSGLVQLRSAGRRGAAFPLTLAAAVQTATLVHGERRRSLASAQRLGRRLLTSCRLPACRSLIGAAVR